ncbi:hypothetical protein T11_2596 [Trichinella zimbabwensis]|uniref:Uncharacterized protein n=1 Tax=Trichinella zimbabwensis TaxID=268475 RepID=A0A0V1G6K2_9BILA|nr:hypothetical protein T11_2596 [Trichinella zimbabwensis]
MVLHLVKLYSLFSSFFFERIRLWLINMEDILATQDPP